MNSILIFLSCSYAPTVWELDLDPVVLADLSALLGIEQVLVLDEADRILDV
jgi:hypothetical protein